MKRKHVGQSQGGRWVGIQKMRQASEHASRVCAYTCVVPDEIGGRPDELYTHACSNKTTGGKYCILHDPDDDKDLNAFSVAVEARIDSPSDRGVELHGTVFPAAFSPRFFSGQVFDSPICLREARFGGRTYLEDSTFTELDLSDATFTSYVSFDRSRFIGDVLCLTVAGARFQGIASIGNAVFEGAVSAVYTRFDEAVGLRKAHFGAWAVFLSTSFGGYTNFSAARFDDRVDFDGASFAGDAMFREAYFGEVEDGSAVELEASFKEVLFQGKADFRSTQFNYCAVFERARFDGNALFMDTRFAQATSFEYALFKDGGFFEGSTFPADSVVDFRYARADSPGTLHFVSNDLSRVRLAHADVEDWYFGDVVWPTADRWLSKTVRYRTRANSVFDELEVPRASSAESIEVLYRRLRANYEAGRGYGEAGAFHIGEMEMRRSGLRPWRESDWYLLGAYRSLSFYGENWAWALIVFALLLLVSATVIALASPGVTFLAGFTYVFRLTTLQRPTTLEPTGLPGEIGLALLAVAGPAQIAMMVLAIRRRVQR